jgi:mannose-6-phosphate isomerase-like protein (cupin superfamily)
MKNIKEYIESGILEIYVLGGATPEEIREVETMAAVHEEVRKEIKVIRDTLETYAMANPIPVNPLVKPLLMATIDYTERIKKGESIAFPPLLNEGSLIKDYAVWLNREDFILPSTSPDTYVIIIGHSSRVTTAIVWIKESTPVETHYREYERFLITEGSCNIIVGEKAYPLKPGDYFSVPLESAHYVQVTSEIPCKVILQRVAA